MNNVLGYSGRRCIVTGAASGMGGATTRILVDLGAEVHAIDIRKPDVSGIASYSETDLSDPAAIAKTAAAIGSVVNNLFNCAGVPGNASGLAAMAVSFCGMRELTECVIPHMIDGAAICSIASFADTAWQGDQEQLAELLATPDFAAAMAWCEAHPNDLRNAHRLSKEAVNTYTAARSVDLIGKGIRINCLNARSTDAPIGRNARPEEQAWPLVFLGSPRASSLTGVSIFAG